jgi:hypothetical protein
VKITSQTSKSVRANHVHKPTTKLSLSGLCTYFQLILLPRDNDRHQAGAKEPFGDLCVHIAFAAEDLIDLVGREYGEEFVASFVCNR